MQAVRERSAVRPEELRRRVDPAMLPFRTTGEVAPLETTIGRPRAAEAIAFALEVGVRGIHLYVAGPPGTGRESTVLTAVRSFAATRPTPPGWVYVHNFTEPDRPRTFSVPAGRARRLATAMASFLEAAQREIPRAFESEDYARRREQSLSEVGTRRAALITDLRAFGQERGFAVVMTPTGIGKIPLQSGQPMSQQVFEQLSPEEKADLEQRGTQVQSEVGAFVRQMQQIEKEAQERVSALDREVALYAVGPLITELREEFSEQPDVLAFIEQIEKNLPEHLQDFLPTIEAGQAGPVTARVSVGLGTVQSIEREIEKSGPIHSKGFLTLTGYLQAQYAQRWPLSLGATITFEQSYGGIDGDSASTTELYALLSALSDLPLHQGIAVTGAVDQHGEVQAVGGVTRKIEGFFDVCRERGLTGEQGVLVPTSNVKHLMVREEVVEAVRAGRFHVWAVSHIDEGIELLTGRPAGERAGDGAFPEGTVHRRSPAWAPSSERSTSSPRSSAMRAPGMTMFRMPIFTWNIFITSLLVLIAFPVLTAALFGLAADRHLGAHVFDPANGGAILWQHLFWFFGHPEVYIVALPFFGIVSEVFPVFSRKPIFGYKTLVFATIAIAMLSGAVWAHHMYATGAVLLAFFSFTTFLIAIPTGIKFVNWIGTMWKGKLTFETPMLFSLGFLVTFLFGGLTGVLLASPAMDFMVSDRYFVVAHFHYVLFGTIVFAPYAGIYFWFPKMTGRMLDETLGKFHFWTTFVGFHLTFLVQHWLGNEGTPRRYVDYLPTDGFTTLNTISSIGAFVLGASTLPFIWNVFRSYRYGRVVTVDDPWGHGNSLEWATSCPPPRHNFTELPRIRSERPAFELH